MKGAKPAVHFGFIASRKYIQNGMNTSNHDMCSNLPPFMLLTLKHIRIGCMKRMKEIIMYDKTQMILSPYDIF